MTFADEFRRLPLLELSRRSREASRREVLAALGRPTGELRWEDFARMISPAAGGLLEELARRSQALTRRRFGRVIRLFAPLYLSNECINNCAYCGFSRDNAILRVTLSVEEVRH
jgi:2-iminoacetate synthase